MQRLDKPSRLQPGNLVKTNIYAQDDHMGMYIGYYVSPVHEVFGILCWSKYAGSFLYTHMLLSELEVMLPPHIPHGSLANYLFFIHEARVSDLAVTSKRYQS